MKRLFDIILSLIGILLFSPLLVPIIIILKFTGEGYIFYKQERVGKDENLFYLLKFATMYKNSSSLPGGNITSKNDSRILPVGKFLRKYKINELPQIINVFLGQMSIIGRRPTVIEHYEFFSPEIRKIISVFKPGLSGISSIIFRDEEKYFKNKDQNENKQFYKNQIAPFKGELEIWYCKNQSFKLDSILIFLTLLCIVFPSSNYHNYFLKNLPEHPLFNSK
jgi:lipopolysaccharide/colanic/teichoic acid biosynthesis glycosyltransferase